MIIRWGGRTVGTLLYLGLANAAAATALALIVAASGRLLADRPAVLHCLWLLVLLKLVTPPLWDVPLAGRTPKRVSSAACFKDPGMRIAIEPFVVEADPV